MKGIPIQEPSPDALVFKDASSTGWGAQCNDLSAAGTWAPDLQDLRINVVELVAVNRALQEFSSASLHQVASDVFLPASSLRIRPQALHVPGKLDVAPDVLSRQREVPVAFWTLMQTICDTTFFRDSSLRRFIRVHAPNSPTQAWFRFCSSSAWNLPSVSH